MFPLFSTGVVDVEKIVMLLMLFLGAVGEDDSWKNLQQKILRHYLQLCMIDYAKEKQC